MKSNLQAMTESSFSLKYLTKVKAEILSQGINLHPTLYENFGAPFLEKRRAYGNQDPLSLRERIIPQELYLQDERIVCSVNVRHNSAWELMYDSGKYLIHNNLTDEYIEVFFPLRPEFYDKKLSSGMRVNRVITLYGGKSLGIYVYGTCSLVALGKPCQYCSIDPNRSKPTDFESVIKPEILEESLEIALNNCPSTTNQIMLNGGNFPDLDKSFLYYQKLVEIAHKVIKKTGREIELHLIVFPPKNLELFNLMKDLKVSISMNTEVFDPLLFKKYCPGKTDTLGQKNLFKALEAAVKALGRGRVYSILVGGLEPLSSLKEGLNFLASLGVIPVINVFHPDPETPLANHPSPQAEEILEMGAALQETYSLNSFMKPFYWACGRNSLDTEAYLKLF